MDRSLSDIMQEIKASHTPDIMDALTERDRSGRGYVCPLCGSGSGKNGTGLTAGTHNPHFFQCWACGFKGDALDLLGAVRHITEPVEQVKEAERILHREFLAHNNGMQNRRETPKQAKSENKNRGEIMVKKNILERAKEAEEQKQKAAGIVNFIMESQQNFKTDPGPALAYLKRRGISARTAYHFGLGYVAKYGDGMNTAAVIIPTGKYSFTARSAGEVDKGRKYRKRNAGGKQGVFNIQTLQEPGSVIFLVEGEFDALSVIEAGYKAIATGGGTSEGELAEIINKSNLRPELFVILPDNDRNEDGTPNENPGHGYEKGLKLLEALKAANIRATMIDTRKWPQHIKDCNDYLVNDRLTFKEMLRGIVEPVTDIAMQRLGRVSDSIQPFLDHITGKTPPVSTGFTVIDGLIDKGFHAGLIVLGAISSLGKTSLALNIADNIAESGQDVIFFSLEMSRYELIAKSISRKTFLYCKAQKQPTNYAKTNIGISDFDRYDRYSPAELDLIDKAQESYQNGAAQNLYIVEGVGNIGTAEIRQHIARHIAVTGRYPVTFIDYLQILAAPESHSTDKQAVDRNILELKRISRDFAIPIIGISSFNRESYWQPVSMSNFKESGSIEYSSDILIALQYTGMDYEKYTEDGKTKYEYDKDKRRAQRLFTLKETIEAETKAGGKVDIDVKVLKNRSGAKGKAVIQYYPMFNCFMEDNRR